jgi:hypothetical protein
MALLDHEAREGRIPWRHVLVQLLLNPLTLAMLLGLVLSLTSTAIPGFVLAPLELLGAMAVPSMLVAYGVALRLGGGFGAGGTHGEIALASTSQLVVQPAVATAVAGYALGLTGHAPLAVAVVSALPTAQNVFTHRHPLPARAGARPRHDPGHDRVVPAGDAADRRSARLRNVRVRARVVDDRVRGEEGVAGCEHQ